jgi:hypothetical protein
MGLLMFVLLVMMSCVCGVTAVLPPQFPEVDKYRLTEVAVPPTPCVDIDYVYHPRLPHALAEEERRVCMLP